MAQIDSSIPLGVRPIEMADPMAMYAKAAQVRNYQLQSEAAQMGLDKDRMDMDQAKTAAQIYRESMSPDGSVDRVKVMRGMADRGLGAKIPALQKSFADADKSGADLAKTKAETTGDIQKTMYEGLKLADNTLASLASDPAVSEQKVMAEFGRLVNIGAFKGPAQHQGKSEDQVARDMLSTMPVGDPNALKNWLMSNAARAADATKRFEMMLPKYDEQNRGGVLNQGTINQMTGQRTAGADIGLSADPNAVLQAGTTRRGQDLVNARTAEANDINKEATRTQLVQTADGGYMRVDKGTGVATPVTQQGAPIQSKDSKPAANTRMAGDMQTNIATARELLKKATGSPVGALVDKTVALTGKSTEGADATAALETLGGWMTANVPRMEGPQSDKDTTLYRQMAGDVSNPAKPISQRLAALDILEKLGQKYLPGGAQYTPPAPVATRPAVQRGGPMTVPARGTPAGRPSLDDFFAK